MNVIMDTSQCQFHQTESSQIKDFQISTLQTPASNCTPLLNLSNKNSGLMKSDAKPDTMPLTKILTSGKPSTFKRSFDVAFLMRPDERTQQKQMRCDEPLECQQSPNNSPPYSLGQQNHCQENYKPAQNLSTRDVRRYMRSNRVCDEPSVIMPAVLPAYSDNNKSSPMRSAFKKVSPGSQDYPPISTAPTTNIDKLSWPLLNPSISMAPPRIKSCGLFSGIATGATISLHPRDFMYQNNSPEYQINDVTALQSANQVQVLRAQRITQQFLYQTPLNSTNITSAIALNDNFTTTNSAITPNEYLTSCTGYPFSSSPTSSSQHSFVTVTPTELPPIVQNPATAAILSTLIPPTLASTYTLTAQNVCAKCNISFRMTSDLVYHMRSHHKSEVACDPNRRKREEKLKCPVCQENFRERHHLTRHMTAHQDKESDVEKVSINGHLDNIEVKNIHHSSTDGNSR